MKRWVAIVGAPGTLMVGATIVLVVNTLALVINLWALLRGVSVAAVWIGVSSCVITGQLYALVIARQKAHVFKQEWAEARAKRAFAEQMVEKMKTATGFSMPVAMDDDDDKMPRH